MKPSCTVLVLLPVYNGARYLAEQIASVLTQQWEPAFADKITVRLLCRDDGSSDHSPALLQDFARRYPDAITLLADESGNLGAAGNFSALMHYAELEIRSAPSTHCYIALADQDDIWQGNKLQRSLTALLAAEGGDRETPVLVHSDLRVVDAGAHVIAESFMAYQGLRPARDSLSAQLLSNTLTGCTALMNPALIRKALPVPAGAVMHDWWLSLIASAFGHRVYLDEALVDYRQHDRNTIGARAHTKSVLSGQALRELLSNRRLPDRQQAFMEIATQAAEFSARHGDELSSAQRFVCRRIMALPKAGLWWQRVMFRVLRLL
ncbi:MAG: hypothetical protein CMQ34_00160 [Gammaproteobacteria bacterium]|nr:hypothetical protein [Gammaproteobacteria bacterium]|tara:strand:+ start:716 stop:1678 length:963 start_codon:yes stop_codon:yes gene_type:complete